MTVIADLSVESLTEDYRRGALSPVEVARDGLARIEAAAAFNAFMPLMPDRGLAEARASEARWRAGASLGVLDGVPATVKDNIWLKGYPTLRGSLTGDEAPAGDDAPAVARLREQGAVFLGKTCMPEHGWIGVCHSPRSGVTRNPWNPAHTPGGSTGGGGVAALLALGLLHLGTDGAGSLRIPAAFTGVFGFKPSVGCVPVYPAPLLNVLSHHGPIARTVNDAAHLMSAIARPDARDMTGQSGALTGDYSVGLDDGVRGCRIALSSRLGHVERLDPEIEEAMTRAARALEAQGAIVEVADPPLSRALDLIRAMWWPVAAAIVDGVPASRRGEMDKGLLKIAERGRALTTTDYLTAFAARAELHNAMRDFHSRHDLLLTPTMPVTALKVGEEMPEGGGYGDDWLNWSPYTYPFNLTGQPAASVPSGLTKNGLPMAVQLVGRLGDDRLVLRASRAVERAMPFPRFNMSI